MKNRKTLCIGLAAALSLAAGSAAAQVYSWRDPATGQRKISNIPPRWYSRGDEVRGPRVVATSDGRVVDDTALPYEQRLQLFGKPKADAGTLNQQRPAGREQAMR